MDRYSRILIIIFLICLINLGLAVFSLKKSQVPTQNNKNQQKEVVLQQASLTPPASSPTPKGSQSDIESIKSDITIIKAEIRALREILNISGSFENAANLLKDLDTNKTP